MRTLVVLGSLLLGSCAVPHYLDNGCVIHGNMFTGDTNWNCPQGSYMLIEVNEDGRMLSATPYRR